MGYCAVKTFTLFALQVNGISTLQIKIELQITGTRQIEIRLLFILYLCYIDNENNRSKVIKKTRGTCNLQLYFQFVQF